jgi:hypothetical protein
MLTQVQKRVTDVHWVWEAFRQLMKSGDYTNYAPLGLALRGSECNRDFSPIMRYYTFSNESSNQTSTCSPANRKRLPGGSPKNLIISGSL